MLTGLQTYLPYSLSFCFRTWISFTHVISYKTKFLEEDLTWLSTTLSKVYKLVARQLLSNSFLFILQIIEIISPLLDGTASAYKFPRFLEEGFDLAINNTLQGIKILDDSYPVTHLCLFYRSLIVQHHNLYSKVFKYPWCLYPNLCSKLYVFSVSSKSRLIFMAWQRHENLHISNISATFRASKW